MKLISSYYWQQEGNAATLLLQQCRLKNMTVLFACICAGRDEREASAGGYLSKRLLGWFRGLSFTEAAAKPSGFLDRQKERLECLIEGVDLELAEAGRSAGEESAKEESAGKRVGLTGVLCVGGECLLFERGNVETWLLNRCLGRACAEKLAEAGEELRVSRCVLEPGAGLLLATKGFAGSAGESAVREGLAVWEVQTERQAEAHLRELGKAGEAAVFLLAKGEKG